MQVISLHVVLSDIIAFTSPTGYARRRDVRNDDAYTTSRVSFFFFFFCHVTSARVNVIWSFTGSVASTLQRAFDTISRFCYKHFFIIALFVVLLCGFYSQNL